MLKKLLADELRRRYFGVNPNPVQIGVYRPSVLSWSCVRRQYNYYSEFAGKSPDEIPDEVVLLLGGGIVFHRMVQALEFQGQPFWDNVEVECKLEVALPSGNILIVGHADCIRNNEVYELKYTQRVPSNPHFQHILQLNFYLGALQKQKGWLVYCGPSTEGGLQIREFPHIFSEWHLEHLISRAQTLDLLLRNQTPPRCSCSDKRHEVGAIF